MLTLPERKFRYLVVEVFEYTSHQKAPILTNDIKAYEREAREGLYGIFDADTGLWLWGGGEHGAWTRCFENL